MSEAAIRHQETFQRFLSNALVISPNLEALLEHDARIRGPSPVPPPKASPPKLSPELESPSIPLPPPPRGRRKGESSISFNTAALDDDSGSAISLTFHEAPSFELTFSIPPSPVHSSKSPKNPFINPAPFLGLEDSYITKGDMADVRSIAESWVDVSEMTYPKPSFVPPQKTTMSTAPSSDYHPKVGRRRSRSLGREWEHGTTDATTVIQGKHIARPVQQISPTAMFHGTPRAKPKLAPVQTSAQEFRSTFAVNPSTNISTRPPGQPVYEEKLTPAWPPIPPVPSPKSTQRPLDELSAFNAKRKHLQQQQAPPANSARTSMYSTWSYNGLHSDSGHAPPPLPTRNPHRTSNMTIKDHHSAFHQFQHSTNRNDQSSEHPLPSLEEPDTEPIVQFIDRPSQRESFMEFASPTSPDFPDSLYEQDIDHLPYTLKESSGMPGDLHDYFDNNTSLGHGRASPTPSTSSSNPLLPQRPTPSEYTSIARSDLGTPRTYGGTDRAPPKFPNFLPPTTNFLKSEERAELVKKTKKLSQVFGETPEAIDLQRHRAADPRSTYLSTLAGAHAAAFEDRPQRGITKEGKSVLRKSKKPSPILPGQTPSLYQKDRKLSLPSPLTPDNRSFVSEWSMDDDGDDADRQEQLIRNHSSMFTSTRKEAVASERHPTTARPRSVESFMDLFDDQPDDGLSVLTSELKLRSLPSELDDEDPAETDRRRKREKLAKLHRFLGSRVPVDVALGITGDGAPLPPPMPLESMTLTDLALEGLDRKALRKRSRSSSVTEPSTPWSDETDRMMADLDEEEKALNVRRAIKMEKVFGAVPPQTMYHSRATAINSLLSSLDATAPPPVPPIPSWKPNEYTPSLKSMATSVKPSFMRAGTHSPPTQLRATTNDPSTSKSWKWKPLRGEGSKGHGQRRGSRVSVTYSHYEHSLMSLSDIIDRDDKQSLAELHQYLHEELPEVPETPSPMTFAPTGRRFSMASTIRTARRLSLPSVISSDPSSPSFISSDSGSFRSSIYLSPVADPTASFQLRRKRVAKLTAFFGVDYNILINDVLESIEKGVDEERRKGALNPDEAADLLAKLQALRNKKDFKA